METKLAEFLLENITGINWKEFNENVISLSNYHISIVTFKERYGNIQLWLNPHFLYYLQSFVQPVGGRCRFV
jgi:hypothetical protein